MADNKDLDTTGHKWDDDEGFPLQEYNNPLPKWWLNSFYATIIWSVVYWVLYPAWPLPDGFTPGTLGTTMRGEYQKEMDEAKAKQKVFNDKLDKLSLKEISKDNQLLQFSISGGKALFGDNCAPCHGPAGIGVKAGGFPTLADDDWLFGGDLDTIQETITNGRNGQMPAHAKAAGGNFTDAQVDDLTQYVLSLSGKSTDKPAITRGDALFRGEAACTTCHGDKGNGSLKGTVNGEKPPQVGAPNLTDGIWLYGGDQKTVRESIAKGRMGEMPAWGAGIKESGRQLSALDIKKLTIYVHSLGGGQ
ncbi:MAG: cytochrome-c oxidase, cbb3-type subunit III [Magnetococcales bacterium]|nr:cytochrome-c oxidase, cbb3-type subunit III [Magnetococcales bacterium]